MMETIDQKGHINIRVSITKAGGKTSEHSIDGYGYVGMNGKAYICVNDPGRTNREDSFQYIDTTDWTLYAVGINGNLKDKDNQGKQGRVIKYRKITRRGNK